MNQPEDQHAGWLGKLVSRIHPWAWIIELVFGLGVAGAAYLGEPVSKWPFRLPSEGSRFILAAVAAIVFVSAAEIYRWITRKQGTFISGRFALGLLRGWPGDKPDGSTRLHKILIIGDSSDEKASNETAIALEDISGPGLQPIIFDASKADPDKKDKDPCWQKASTGVSAFYLLRTRNTVEEAKREWISHAVLELCKTKNVHSPVVEADIYPEAPDTPIFYRIQEKVFPKKVHVLFTRAIERAVLMSSQARFNRFVLLLFMTAVVIVVIASRLPSLFHSSASVDDMTHLTDLVSSQYAERDLLEKCFPTITPTLKDANCVGRVDQIREAIKTTIKLELMDISDAKHLRTKPRLTVWRSTQYKDHSIIFVAGASEDPGTHVFLDDPPNERKTDRDSIIGGALLIRGWVLWRADCPQRGPDAAWTSNRQIVGRCMEDGSIETTGPIKSTIKYNPSIGVPLAALLCYGDIYGNGACIGVTDNATILEDEPLRQDLASLTRLIAGRPTSLLFGEDLRTRADELVQSRTNR